MRRLREVTGSGEGTTDRSGRCGDVLDLLADPLPLGVLQVLRLRVGRPRQRQNEKTNGYEHECGEGEERCAAEALEQAD